MSCSIASQDMVSQQLVSPVTACEGNLHYSRNMSLIRRVDGSQHDASTCPPNDKDRTSCEWLTDSLDN